MFKNTASQKIQLLAIDTATNTPKTGDAANITAYVAKDFGTVTVLIDTSATEMDATNAPGMYLFDVAQAETNADTLLFTAKSSTSGIRIVPVQIFTRPPNFSLLSVDGSGKVVTPDTQKVDLNTIKTQTVTCSGGVTVPAATLASTTNITAATGITVSTNSDKTGYSLTATTGLGNQTANITGNITGTVSTVTTVTNQLTAAQIATGVWQDATAGDFTAANSIGKSVLNGVTLGTGLTINGYTGNTPQTGDSFARIGAAGASLTALGDTRIANLDATISSRGTSTLTQTQVTGGAYSLASASFVCGDTRLANLDATVTSASGGVFTRTFRRKYATGTGNSVGIQIPLAGSSTYATSSDWTPATGDVKISKDGGTEANITSLPSYSNGWWYFAFSNTELTAKRVYVRVSDTAPKAVKDISFVVDTYGNASAQVIQDLGAANWQADIKAYDGVAQTPSAAGYPDVNLVALGGLGFALDDLAHIAYQGKRMLFVSTAGSSGNDGLSPSTAKALISEAIAVASAGDVILVEAGTYDQVTTVVDVPDDVTIIGAGWQNTIVNSQVQNVTPNFRSIIEPGSRCRVKGIAFIGNYTGNAAQRGVGVGSGSGAFTDAVFEDCRFFGNVDGLQLAKLGATNSAKFYRCRFESGFDAVAISYGTNTLEFYDCEFLADAALLPVGYTTAGAICRGIVAASTSTTKLSVHNGRFLSQGASDTNTGVQVTGSSSTVNLFGGWFNCSIYDLEQTGGTLNAFDVPYDSAKASGTINKYSMGIAQGYNSTLATNIGTTNTRVDVTSSTLATASAITTLTGYVDTEVAAMKAVLDKLDTTMVLDGAVYQFTANAMELSPSGGSSFTIDEIWDEVQSGHAVPGSFGAYLNQSISSIVTSAGSGASVVTITVNDGTDPIQGAVVALTSNGVMNGYGTTNASGIVPLTPNSGDITYTVSIAKSAFTFTPTTLAVSGATSRTYSMSAISISPAADPANTTLYFTAYNNSLAGTSGIVFEFVLDTPGLTTGYSFPRDTITATSGTAGLTQVTLLRSSTYKGRRINTDGTPSEWVDITTADASTTQAPGILGAPQD